MTSSKRTATAFAGSRLAGTYASMGARSAATASASAAASAEHTGPVESAWQRWEMQSIGTPSGRRGAPAGRAPHGTPDAPPRPATPLDEKLLARLRGDARSAGESEGRREGFARGHAEGLEAGRMEGRMEGRAEGLALATAHAEQLRALMQGYPAALRRAEQEMSGSLIALAIDVARQVVHHSLSVEPGWIVPLVQQLLQTDPALQGEPRLLLHPEDVALVRSSLGSELQEAGWQVRADESMSRGGCRVQAAGSEIDATLETRWDRVTAALGGTEARGTHAQ